MAILPRFFFARSGASALLVFCSWGFCGFSWLLRLVGLVAFRGLSYNRLELTLSPPYTRYPQPQDLRESSAWATLKLRTQPARKTGCHQIHAAQRERCTASIAPRWRGARASRSQSRQRVFLPAAFSMSCGATARAHLRNSSLRVTHFGEPRAVKTPSFISATPSPVGFTPGWNMDFPSKRVDGHGSKSRTPSEHPNPH